MYQWNYTAAKIFGNANRFIEAYHTALQPICKKTGLPPMAADILMFVANNPQNGTAKDICRCRGFKSGIVSVHVDRLVNEGLLLRKSVAGDRRKTRLVCTDTAGDIIKKGRELQKSFAERLLIGLSDEDIAVFRNCLAVIGENIEKIRKSGVAPNNQNNQKKKEDKEHL